FVADPERCGVVVVTTPEEMPVAEALELAERLDRDLDRGVELLAINGVYPPLPAGARADADDPALDLWTHRRQLQEREMARLAERWRGPRVALPKLPVDRGPELIGRLETCLARGLDAPLTGGAS
ncbi:MAG TPA: hypothetical protein VKU40_02115, partial [Thermoanaerobaculia bacterium]|nr:hypothetical protein [Thermoanaerobaculia bacterium]